MSFVLFGSVMGDAGNRLSDFFSTFNAGPLAVIDILLVAAIFYWLYTILKETRALWIIYGILILVVFFGFAKLLHLELLAFLFANFLTLLFVAIPVLFQPELRRALERLGRTGLRPLHPRRKSGASRTVAEVSEAVTVLSQDHTGAIIVLKRTTGLADLSTGGTDIDAKVSAALLLNIFHERAPLHDGAVVIDVDRVVAAGVMLPLSDREYGYTLGARHRAAVGLTEQCDALVIVVSEEKGIVSLVVGGKMTPGIDPAVLPQILSEFLTQQKPQDVFKRLRKRVPGGGAGSGDGTTQRSDAEQRPHRRAAAAPTPKPKPPGRPRSRTRGR